MKKNKIIHIISGLKQGGAESILYNLLLNTKDKYDITVISLSLKGYYYNKIKNTKNIKIYEIDFSVKFYFLFKMFYLIFLVRKVNPSIIQSWMYHANFITIFLKIFFINKKIIWNIRNSNLNFTSSKKLTIILSFISSFFSYLIPKKIISCSKSITDYHVSIGYNKNKFITIENGCDDKLFYFNSRWRNKIRDYFNLNNNTKFIGFINRFDDQKNFDCFFRILLKLKKHKYDFKAIICGEKINNNKNLLDKINKYDLSKNIIIGGIRKKIYFLYSALDYSISTSTYGEGFQNTLLESISTKTIPLFSNSGDAKYVLKGVLDTFDGNDDSEYFNCFKAIDKLDNNQKNELINLLTSISKHYTLEKMCLQYIKVYEKYSNKS